VLELLLLLLELLLLGAGVLLEPPEGAVNGRLDRLAVGIGQLALDLLVVDRVADVEGVVLEAVLGLQGGAAEVGGSGGSGADGGGGGGPRAHPPVPQPAPPPPARAHHPVPLP
jgi:hypothetical protein